MYLILVKDAFVLQCENCHVPLLEVLHVMVYSQVLQILAGVLSLLIKQRARLYQIWGQTVPTLKSLYLVKYFVKYFVKIVSANI